MLKDLLQKNRSVRRFHQDQAIAKEVLVGLVELVRYLPSRANAQPLKYVLSNDPASNAAIFGTLGWFSSGGISGAPEGERPSAYIVIVLDRQVWRDALGDSAIAAHALLLGATELGFGGSIVATVERSRLAEILKLSPQFEIQVVVALGKPKETVRIAPVDSSGSTVRFQDAAGQSVVPKRSVEDFILKSFP